MKKYQYNYRILIVALVILVVGAFVVPTNVMKGVKNVVFQSIRPFSLVGGFTADKTSMFFRNLFHLSKITKENENLIKENLDLQSQLSVLKEAQHENEILKQELGFANTKKDLNLTSANIIGRSIAGYLRTIVIDRGEADSIKIGQAVLSQGYLVGTVKEVYQNTSEVTLITNYNSLVPVILQESRGTGLLRGGLQGLTVEEIPLNITIKSGENVVTSGLGGVVPAGILIGKVGTVVSHEGEIFQKTTVNSPIQIYYLEFVFVAKQ